ncbi:MAG TPA: hypothetical protein VF963_04810 [Gaiellaceae bacterium]
MKLRGDDWARKWKSAPIEQRRRVARAVARGEAVADPRDAPLAVELAERKQQRLQSRRSGWFSRWHLVIYAGSGVVAVVFTRDVVFAALFVLSTLCFAASRVSLRRIERRAGEAHQKNEKIVRQL